ncbi:MAG: heme-binding protein [Candidatus Nanopelagicales bacterium]|nr:heme-binding protein [Candidatus Nanopelagicales bacterium]
MTQEQPHGVVRECDGYQLRRYPACVIAEVTVAADFDKAGSLAFQPLFTYISGNNLGQVSIDMTAPVVQRESGELETGASTGRSEKLSMTAPVLQSSDVSGQQVVAFVLPSSVTAASAPTPLDSRVVIREIPPSLTAATRYSGRWSRSGYNEHLQQLQSALERDGLRAVGEPRFARFDSPMKPWFLRRNEVHIDVEDTTDVGG